ncbi:MAG: HAD hydrolase-like protein [Acidobacteriota bacterium]
MIVFDMDGVLVEVGESYRETICQTVAHFTGRMITRELVQEYKNAGGWNNDWALSQKIARDLGTEVEFDTVRAYFDSIFFGTITDGIPDGLMSRERWIASPGVLEGLSERFQFSVFTGRLRDEAQLTLNRFAKHLQFQPLVGADDVTQGKPHPEGLEKIVALQPDIEYWYIGDTVDDARASKAADVPFIGIAAPGVPFRDELVRLLEAEDAEVILNDINQLPEFLAK